MAQFPKLKTGAVTQYPIGRGLRYSTQVQRFLDSSEQRYRDHASGRRRWVVELAQLDESELAEVRELFVDSQGAGWTFEFEDPWTALVAPNCRFADDLFESLSAGELDSRLTVTIVEVS